MKLFEKFFSLYRVKVVSSALMLVVITTVLTQTTLHYYFRYQTYQLSRATTQALLKLKALTHRKHPDGVFTKKLHRLSLVKIGQSMRRMGIVAEYLKERHTQDDTIIDFLLTGNYPQFLTLLQYLYHQNPNVLIKQLSIKKNQGKRYQEKLKIKGMIYVYEYKK